MRGPSRSEDTKNVAVISIAAAVALIATVAFIADSAPSPIDFGMPAPAPAITPTVSWTDLLDATKEGRTSTISGIRFRHVAPIEVLGSHSALLTLRSGEEQFFSGRATDLGSGLRALQVDDARRGLVELGWNDLQAVTFAAAPDGSRPRAEWLYSTNILDGKIDGVEEEVVFGDIASIERIDGRSARVSLASGDQLSGDLVWDNDEAFSWEMLNGESQGVEFHLEFGNIATIERFGCGVMVGLHDGRTFEVWGSNDVDSGNRGILVKDESGSTRRIAWDAFRSVRFTQQFLPQGP